jgi:hypothetical protein
VTISHYRLTDPALLKILTQVPGPITFTTLPSGLRVIADAPASSQADLDEVMARYGYELDTSLPVVALATTKLVDDKLVPDAAWNTLGGAVAWPSSYFGDLSRLLIRTVGAYTATGGDIELQLLEDGITIGGTTLSPAAALTVFSFDAPVTAKSARSIYELQARQTTASAGRVAYTSTGVLLLPG